MHEFRPSESQLTGLVLGNRYKVHGYLTHGSTARIYLAEDLLESIESENTSRTWGRRDPEPRGTGMSGLAGTFSAANAVAKGEGVAQPRREAIAIETGDTVVHERWGEGVVLNVQGRGQDVQATVRFDEVGEKRLLVAFAPLSKKTG